MNIVVKCPKCRDIIELVLDTLGKKTYYVYRCSNKKCGWELGRKLLREKK